MNTSSITELDEHPRRTEKATNLVTRSTEGSTEISGERVGEMTDDVKPKHHNFAEKERPSDLGVETGSGITKIHESDVAPVVMKPADQQDGTKAGELACDLKVPKLEEKKKQNVPQTKKAKEVLAQKKGKGKMKLKTKRVAVSGKMEAWNRQGAVHDLYRKVMREGNLPTTTQPKKIAISQPQRRKLGCSDSSGQKEYRPLKADDAYILNHPEWKNFVKQRLEEAKEDTEGENDTELKATSSRDINPPTEDESRIQQRYYQKKLGKITELSEKKQRYPDDGKIDDSFFSRTLNPKPQLKQAEEKEGFADEDDNDEDINYFSFDEFGDDSDDEEKNEEENTSQESMESWEMGSTTISKDNTSLINIETDCSAFLIKPETKIDTKPGNTTEKVQVPKTRVKTRISPVKPNIAVISQHGAEKLGLKEHAEAKTASQEWQPISAKKSQNQMIRRKQKTNSGVIEIGVRYAHSFVKATRSLYITGDVNDRSNSHPQAREIRNTWQRMMKPILEAWTQLFSKIMCHGKKVKWCIQYVADSHLSGLTKPPRGIGLGHWQNCQPFITTKDQSRWLTSRETSPGKEAFKHCCRCAFEDTIMPIKPPCSNTEHPCKNMTNYVQGVNVYVLNDVLYYEKVRATMIKIMQSRRKIPTFIFYSYHTSKPGTYTTPDGGTVVVDNHTLVQQHGANDKKSDIYTTELPSLPVAPGFTAVKLLEWSTFVAGYITNMPILVDFANIPGDSLPIEIMQYQSYKSRELPFQKNDPTVQNPQPPPALVGPMQSQKGNKKAKDNSSETSSVSFQDSDYTFRTSPTIDEIIDVEESNHGCLYDALFDNTLAPDVGAMKKAVLDHMAKYPEHFFLLKYKRRHCYPRVQVDQDGVDCADYMQRRRTGKDAGAREILAFCSLYQRSVLVKTDKYRKIYGDKAPHEVDHRIKFSENHYYKISTTSGKKTRMINIPDLGLSAHDIRMRWLGGGSEAMGLVSTIHDSDEGAGDSDTSSVSLFMPSQTTIRPVRIPDLRRGADDSDEDNRNNITVNLLSDPTRVAWVTNGWRQEIWVGPGGVWSGPDAERRSSMGRGSEYCVSLPPKAAVKLAQCVVTNLPQDLETLKDREKLINKLLATAASASTTINTLSASTQEQFASFTSCRSWTQWFTIAYANKVVDDVEKMLEFVEGMRTKAQNGGFRKGYCCAGSDVVKTLNSRDRPNLRFFVDKESAQNWLAKVNGAQDGGLQPYAALVLDSHAFTTYSQHVITNADGHNIFENFGRRVEKNSRTLAAEIMSLPASVRDMFFNEQQGPRKWINVFLMEKLQGNIFNESFRHVVEAAHRRHIRLNHIYHIRDIPTHNKLYPGEIEQNFGFDIVRALIANHSCSNRQTRQIGPSFTTKPLCAQTCFANLLVAFITRQAGGKPREGGPLVAHHVGELSGAMTRMISGYRNSDPLSRAVLASRTAEDNQYTANATQLPTFQQWLTGYGGQAAAKMIDMHLKVQRNERDMANVANVNRNITGFVKLEFHGEEENGLACHGEPRIISDRCVDFKYNGIGITKQLSKILQELTPCYAVYDNPRKVADDIAQYINIHGTDLVARNTDYSRMDGSTCQRVKEQINECYKKLFDVIEQCPATSSDVRTVNARQSFFASLDQAQISPYNLPYKQQYGWKETMKGFTLGTVASGDFHTTIGNTLLNLLINFQAIEAVSKILDRRLVHGEDFFLRVTGDDGLLLTTPDIAVEYDQQVVQIAEQYGMSLKIEQANVQPEAQERQMAFCSHIFIPTAEGVMVMRPLKRSLTRIGWSLNKQLDSRGLLKAKVLSELTWAEKVPVVGAFYTALFNEVQDADIALERGTRFKLYSHISGGTETQMNRFRQDIFGNLKPRLALLSEKKINKTKMTNVIKHYASQYSAGAKEFSKPSYEARIGFCNLTGLSLDAQRALEDRFSRVSRSNLLENLPIDFLNWLDGVPGMD